MDENIEAVIGEGGRWTHAQAELPGAQAEHDGAHFEIILPNVPNRVDVPAPSQAPWSGVGLLNFFQAGNLTLVGTGFLCQPDVLVTARHNLTAKQYDAAGVWMATDALHNPHVQPITIKAYATHKDLDLAIFILASPQFGAFELGGQLPPAFAGVTLAGYALPYPNGAVRFSYAIGPVKAADPTHLSYAINTREGDSGAPVFVVVNGIPQAVGVHTEAAANPQLGNSGVHLSPPVVQDVFKMIAWARTQIGGHP